MSFGLYIDVLSVSMRSSVFFLFVYMNIVENIFWDCLDNFEMFVILKTVFCYFKFNLRTHMLSIE